MSKLNVSGFQGISVFGTEMPAEVCSFL